MAVTNAHHDARQPASAAPEGSEAVAPLAAGDPMLRGVPPWWFEMPTPGGSEPALEGPEFMPIYTNLNRAVSDLPPPAQGGDRWPPTGGI